MSEQTPTVFDVIIAGAGFSGVLLARRLIHAKPGLRVCLLEREAEAGGRVHRSVPEKGLWSYGLNAVSEELYQFIDQTLKLDADGADLAEFSPRREQLVGVLAAGKMSQLPVSELFSAKGARAIGGGAAVRDWKHLIEIGAALNSGKRKDQAFHSLWSGSKKSPAVVVLEQMALAFGIPDLWSASSSCVFTKAQEFCGERYRSDWHAPIAALMHNEGSDEAAIEFKSQCQVIGANFDDAMKTWTVSTRCGQFQAGKLVVAQPAWEALQWLPKNYWPTSLLQFAVKAKPVSVVALSVLTDPWERSSETPIPDVVLVPAEGVQAAISSNGEICYQATIDYEISLQAPDVVKAVKALKRAKKKLETLYPQLTSEAEHIALLAAAWSQATAFADRRYGDKLTLKNINSEHLLFCGDTYGRDFDGDRNLIQSVRAALGQLTGSAVEIIEDTPAIEELEQSSDDSTTD